MYFARNLTSPRQQRTDRSNLFQDVPRSSVQPFPDGWVPLTPLRDAAAASSSRNTASVSLDSATPSATPQTPPQPEPSPSEPALSNSLQPSVAGASIEAAKDRIEASFLLSHASTEVPTASSTLFAESSAAVAVPGTARSASPRMGSVAPSSDSSAAPSYLVHPSSTPASAAHGDALPSYLPPVAEKPPAWDPVGLVLRGPRRVEAKPERAAGDGDSNRVPAFDVVGQLIRALKK